MRTCLTASLYQAKRTCSSYVERILGLYHTSIDCCSTRDVETRIFFEVTAGCSSGQLERHDQSLRHYLNATTLLREKYGDQHYLYFENLAYVANAFKNTGQFEKAYALHKYLAQVHKTQGDLKKSSFHEKMANELRLFVDP